MDSHQYVNQSSGKTEYYSPPEIIEAARRTMGGIDLDTASSAAANRVVKAEFFYGRPTYVIEGEIGGLPVRRYFDLGGLSYPWFGRVFMNHPFGVPERACAQNCKKKGCKERGWHTAVDIPGNADWINRVVSEYRHGRITQACVLTFASVSEAWFRPLLSYPICFFYGRVNYIDPDTGRPANGVTKGSCVTYLGPDVEAFAREFHYLGRVYVPFEIMHELERPRSLITMENLT